ncbi:MAG: hypothetical protein R3B41_02070 [Candidatus Doudnabacteria bacterium]
MKLIAKFLSKSENFALLVGLGLFLVGFLGFLFKSSTLVPNTTLLLFIAIGIWGILVGVNHKIK